MIKRIVIGGAAILAIGIVTPICALERTVPAKQDKTIRHVVYDPNNVVPLKMTLGMALVIEFGAEEHIVKVAVSDSKRLEADIIKDSNEKLANYLWVKPILLEHDSPDYVFPSQPLTVVTERKGGLRSYIFRVEVKSDGEYETAAVTFSYPQDEYRKRQEEARERERQAATAETKALLTRETNLVSGAAAPDPSWNYRYSAKGDSRLAPAWIWDDGFKTSFHWPAMQSIPSIFRGKCNTNEATENPATHNDVVIVPGASPYWCLRDEYSALEIYNLGYTLTGQTPGTGTVSPDVVREVKGGR